jgi:hypothetical protein
MSSNMIEKIRKIDKKTMRNNILLGLMVTLGTGFYLYMNKKSSHDDEPIYLEENDSDNDIGNDSLYDYGESSKVIFDDLKQTLLNKLEETDKNNRTELKKLEDDIRTISEKLDKTQLTQHIDKDADKDKSVSLLDYIFPPTEKQNNVVVEVKPEEKKNEEIIKINPEEATLLVPEVLDKQVEEPKKEEATLLVPEVLDKQVEEPKKEEAVLLVLDKPVEEQKKEDEIKKDEAAAANIDAAQKPIVIKEDEKKIEGGTLKNKNKSKKNKNKNKNKILNQLLKKLGYTLKRKLN